MKENFICSVPFTSLEVHDHKRFLCCASWLTKYLPEDSSPKEAWDSNEANEIRDSILDGSYKFCDSNQCPFLDKLKKGNTGDEFLVEKKNPLVLPPEFSELPQPGSTNISKENDEDSFETKILNNDSLNQEENSITESNSTEDFILKNIKKNETN